MAARLLSVSIRDKRFREIRVLGDIAFDVQEGEIVSLVGPSGSGKSTLLRIIAGLETNYAGQVDIRGHKPRLHSRDIGLIFQEPRLLPWLTVAENVGFDIGRRATKSARVRELLSEVGLLHAADLYPKQLSGGMAQRAAIARGLFNQPPLLLLDEPFSAVDAFTRMKLQDLLLSAAEKHGTTLLLVTHDISEAIYLSDRVIALSPSPATVAGTVAVAVSRPRARRSSEMSCLEGVVLNLLN